MPADRKYADSSGGTGIEPAGRPPEWVLGVVNPLLKLLLRSPLHVLASDDLALLTVTGRRSGAEYTFPVAYERENGTLRVASFETNWWKNLRDGGQEVAVALRGERLEGHGEVEEGDRAVAEYVRGYLERNGADADTQVGLDLPSDEIPSVETLEPAVGHVVVVTIDLDGA